MGRRRHDDDDFVYDTPIERGLARIPDEAKRDKARRILVYARQIEETGQLLWAERNSPRWQPTSEAVEALVAELSDLTRWKRERKE